MTTRFLHGSAKIRAIFLSLGQPDTGTNSPNKTCFPPDTANTSDVSADEGVAARYSPSPAFYHGSALPSLAVLSGNQKFFLSSSSFCHGMLENATATKFVPGFPNDYFLSRRLPALTVYRVPAEQCCGTTHHCPVPYNPRVRVSDWCVF
jgi:hypothetical protein